MVKTDVVTNHILLPNKSQMSPNTAPHLVHLPAINLFTPLPSLSLSVEIFCVSQLPGPGTWVSPSLGVLTRETCNYMFVLGYQGVIFTFFTSRGPPELIYSTHLNIMDRREGGEISDAVSTSSTKYKTGRVAWQ